MKNDSWRHPYETHFDKCYDDNKDGQLTGMETIFRDAYIDEENRKIDEAWKNSTKLAYSSKDETKMSPMTGLCVMGVLILLGVMYNVFPGLLAGIIVWGGFLGIICFIIYIINN